MENLYERSVFVECSCKTINELPLDESQPIRITGRPKNIAEGKCSKCGSHIVVYASIYIESPFKDDKKLVTEKPIIEVYYDPNGIKSGKTGCFRARFKENYKIHSAGDDIYDALTDLMCTLGSFGMSFDRDDYEIKYIEIR